MITVDERINEYEVRVRKLKGKASKYLDSNQFEKAVGAIMGAKALQETIFNIYVLKGEGQFKEDES